MRQVEGKANSGPKDTFTSFTLFSNQFYMKRLQSTQQELASSFSQLPQISVKYHWLIQQYIYYVTKSAEFLNNFIQGK